MRKLLICFALLLMLPIRVRAIEPVDVEAECSLTLHYQKDGEGFADVPVKLYRVARADPDGTFDLIAPFDSYPVNIHGIQSTEEWDRAATTLKGYIAEDDIAPDKTMNTDEKGIAAFTGLETGLYLTAGAKAENDDGIYTFRWFFTYLPTPTETGFDYDMEASPKPGEYTPKTEYKVVKLWNDTGASGSRPDSVSVELRKDGVLQETLTLNSSNGWSHSWKVRPGEDGEWTVSEKAVPNGYTVTVLEKDNTFTITNTKKAASSSGTPPKTGDTFALLPWTMVLCLSGSGLLVIGTHWARRKRR